jgi:intergrase/recombinase
MNESSSASVQVLQTYLSTVDKRDQSSQVDRVEMSEIELYTATVMHEGEQLDEALRVLTHPHSFICDKVSKLELQVCCAHGLETCHLQRAGTSTGMSS